MDPPDNRRVKQAIRAWRTDLPDEQEHLSKGAIVPVGEPVEIEPFEEIHVLRWTSIGGEAMALVSLRDALYIVTEDDLEQRTIRVFKPIRR